MGEKNKVGAGVVALAAALAVAAGGGLFYGARYLEDQFLGGYTNSEFAHQKALELLGTEHLPVGYNAIGYSSLTNKGSEDAGEAEIVFLSTSEPAERLADLVIGDRVFIFSLRDEESESPVSIVSDSSELFISEGMVEFPGGLANYESYRGEVPVLDQSKSGIVAELEIRCERDGKQRNAAWLTPDPNSSQLVTELDLRGTPADENALAAFLSLLRICPETGELQEWAELRTIAREAAAASSEESPVEFLKRVKAALRAGVAERVQALHYLPTSGAYGEPVQIEASPLDSANPDRVHIEPLPRTFTGHRTVDGKAYLVAPEPVGLLVIDGLDGNRTQLPYGRKDGTLYVCTTDTRSQVDVAQVISQREERLLKISLIGDSSARVRTACRVEGPTGEVFDETATLNGGALSALRGQRFRACLFRKEAGGNVKIALIEGEDRVFLSSELETGKKVSYPVRRKPAASEDSTPVR